MAPFVGHINSQLSQLSRLSQNSLLSRNSQLSRFSLLSTLSTPSPDFHRCKPRQGQQPSLQQMNCHQYNKLSTNCHPLSDYKERLLNSVATIVINLINCQPIVIHCLIIISELARLFDADRRRFSIILSCSRFFNGFAV